ncbi:DNA ligase (ATP) [Sphingomonas antarctica]|uniref:DNA ligase D n=1 Tax=Sphingomonas antarctica TaxID=2040274 RepID=UPI0039EBBE2C
MAKTNPLAKYNAKRDFAQTKEPAGKVAKAEGFSFMVQKHDATRLHYDFRLEMDGVLKSWAVTRGPSLNPDDKRLSVRTEDHPLGYATFEGTIPKGQYGGGTVMLWDRGLWVPHPGKDPRKTIEEGHLHFTLEGERMKGEWLMIRLKPRGREKNENWLLRKIQDEFAGGSDDLVERYLTSVKTGRTMEEIAGGKAEKEDRRPGGGRGRSQPARSSASGPGLRRGDAKLPAFQKPQLATLVDAVPTGSSWLHEMKYDGYRALVAVAGGRAKVFTRTGLDWSAKFPTVVAAAEELKVGSALIDGEIVALDEQGRPNFSGLQAGIKGGGADLVMFAFDLLSLDGHDLKKRGNLERKEALRAILPEGGDLRFADHVIGKGEKLFKAMCDAGVEGIVSKLADAPYSGKRSPAWQKVKCTQRQEFVIVGWTESDTRTRAFSSLLLGLNEGGKLRYAGKVGTGFDAALLADIGAKLKTLERKTAPVEVPKAAARRAHWVEPKLVAEVGFAEFTVENVVRHASFAGLREDKPAKEVVPEKPVKATTAPTYRITNPDRVIDTDSGITKGELAAFYETVAPIMLPVLGHRPVSLVRCPQGRAKHCFFQKHDAGSFGEHVHHVPIKEKDGSTEDYLWLDDAEGILDCVQMGTIEFHGWGARIDDLEAPDRMIFDLDPDEGLDFEAVRKAAFDISATLSDLGLVSFPMLSGGKGVHVVVPLTPQAKWPAVKDFTHRFAVALETQEPERYVANMAKAKRVGRIFVDYLRNQRGSTAVLPYVARARAGVPVSAPISWEELRTIDKPSHFSIRDADELLARASSPDLQGWGVAAQILPDF